MKNKNIIKAYYSIKDEYDVLWNNFYRAVDKVTSLDQNTVAFKEYSKAWEELEKFENSEYEEKDFKSP